MFKITCEFGGDFSITNQDANALIGADLAIKTDHGANLIRFQLGVDLNGNKKLNGITVFFDSDIEDLVPLNYFRFGIGRELAFDSKCLLRQCPEFCRGWTTLGLRNRVGVEM